MSEVQSVRTPVVPVIEPEAIEYARKEGIETIVERLAEGTARVYPSALGVRVLLKLDPELSDYWYVIFEVRMLAADLPDWQEADYRWFVMYDKAYPYPRQHNLLSRVIVEDVGVTQLRGGSRDEPGRSGPRRG